MFFISFSSKTICFAMIFNTFMHKPIFSLIFYKKIMNIISCLPYTIRPPCNIAHLRGMFIRYAQKATTIFWTYPNSVPKDRPTRGGGEPRPGVSGILLESIGISCRLLGSRGPSWTLLGSPRASWDFMWAPKISWLSWALLGPPGASRDLLWIPGISRSLLGSPGISSGLLGSPVGFWGLRGLPGLS